MRTLTADQPTWAISVCKVIAKRNVVIVTCDLFKIYIIFCVPNFYTLMSHFRVTSLHYQVQSLPDQGPGDGEEPREEGA